MIDGVINVYKEAGFTSHDVVAKLRGILRQKKIGHTGTLDPEAAGVLPVCLGKGTRLCDMLTDKKKTYETVLLLGVSTDTQDTTGTVLKEREVTCSSEEAEAAVESFLGDQMQIPPMYSALKVNGKKLYELAREGIEVERQPRPVHFYEIEILNMTLPRISLRVTCSKGTYIRTLCHDIGEKLGCGAAMEKLVRTRVDRFSLENSHTLEEIASYAEKNEVMQLVTSVEEMFAHLPSFTCPPSLDKLLLNGNPVDCREAAPVPLEGWVRAYDSQGTFIGIYARRQGSHRYYPVKMFH